MGHRHTLVVTSADPRSAETSRDAVVVRTLLDMITRLERVREAVATVILGGDFAQDRELSAFIRETYPDVAVVVAGVRAASAPCMLATAGGA